jgi:diacylglycerol kinase (ATP)
VRIGVLNNLRAGRSGREVSKILEVLRDYPHVAHVETESVRAVPEALASLARQDVELLVVNGGDGTLQYTVTRILNGDEFGYVPMVAPLRGGRTNMSALDLGAQRNPVSGLRSLLEDVAAGRVGDRFVDRAVLRVETPRDGRVDYGFFFGAGVIPRAIALTHDVFPQGKTQGAIGAGLVTMSLIARAGLKKLDGVVTPDKALVTLDGREIPHGEFTLLIASSLDRLFLRMKPFWGVGPKPVRFTSIATGAERLSLAAPGILRGKPRSFVRTGADYTSENVDTAEMRIDCGYTVDGEMIEPRNDEIVRIGGDRRITFVRA